MEYILIFASIMFFLLLFLNIKFFKEGFKESLDPTIIINEEIFKGKFKKV